MAGPHPHPDERTVARELALKILYVVDLSKPEQIVEQQHEVLEIESDSEDARRMAAETVQSIRDDLTNLDEIIQEAAVNWQVSRMPVLDRAILRMGVWELLNLHDVPPRVTINEAVEMAKKYSTEKSGAFVNGVLDKIFQTHCPEKV